MCCFPFSPLYLTSGNHNLASNYLPYIYMLIFWSIYFMFVKEIISRNFGKHRPLSLSNATNATTPPLTSPSLLVPSLQELWKLTRPLFDQFKLCVTLYPPQEACPSGCVYIMGPLKLRCTLFFSLVSCNVSVR